MCTLLPPEFNDELAKQHGVEGFQDVQDNMENVSVQKQALDSSKGTEKLYFM